MTLHITPLNYTNIAFERKHKKSHQKSERTSDIQKDTDKFEKKSSKVADIEDTSDILDDIVDDTTSAVDDDGELKGHGKSIKKFIGNSVNKWQNFLKFKARASEYIKGGFNGVIAGLGVGGAIMSMDWAMNGIARVAKKEASSTMFIKEPAKLITNSFSKVFKGLYNLPNLTIKEVAYNFVHSPIDLFKYVKNAPNVSKVGKTFAPLVGGGVLAYSLCKSVLRANQRVANIEHAFNSGHAHDLK